MKNMAKADRPKSAMAILPLRPLRGSGNAAQTAFRPERSDAKTSIPSVNHVSADLGIRKIRQLLELLVRGILLDFAVGAGHIRVKPLRCGHWRAGRVKGFSVRLLRAL